MHSQVHSLGHSFVSLFLGVPCFFFLKYFYCFLFLFLQIQETTKKNVGQLGIGWLGDVGCLGFTVEKDS